MRRVRWLGARPLKVLLPLPGARAGGHGQPCACLRWHAFPPIITAQGVRYLYFEHTSSEKTKSASRGCCQCQDDNVVSPV